MLTLCPPGPLEQNVSMRISFGSIWMSTSSASGSTATVAVDVWTRPLGLGLWDTLDAMDAALVFEPAVDAVTLDQGDHFLEPTVARLVA